MATVGVIMGSKSDSDIVEPVVKLLEELGVEVDHQIVSAHRTPERIKEYTENAEDKGYKAIIAAAGGSAHLPGMTASETQIPVIALPVRREHHGDEALKSSIAMPPGVPVAVVSANGSVNAAILATQIAATSDADILQNLKDYRTKLHDQVLNDNQDLQSSK